MRIKPGFGYWSTDHYPIGGSFHRAPQTGLPLLKILRTFSRCHGANCEALTTDYRKVAFDSAHLAEGMSCGGTISDEEMDAREQRDAAW